MSSLWIILTALVTGWLLTGAILAISARALGSPRGRLLIGVVVVLLINCVAIADAAAGILAGAMPKPFPFLVDICAFLAELCLFFVVFKRAFRLSVARTFGLFGVYIFVGIAQVIFALLVVKPYIVEAFLLSTESMKPTINPDDRFLVNKLISPRRWDVIAYRHADSQGTFVYCKRLVGLPGERLRFEGGEVYVNDQKMTPPAVVAGRYHASPFENPAMPTRYQDGETIVLGDRDFFVVGDNVRISSDSRISGPVDAASIVGVVDLIYWPPNRFAIYH